MPFENESMLNAYAKKINDSKKGADILFKKTVVLLQADKVVPANSTLKNVDETIRERLSISTKADLFKVLVKIDEKSLCNYFLKIEELFKQNSVDNEVIIKFIHEILSLLSDKQLGAVGRLPEALFVLTKKILTQLPTSARVPATFESAHASAMVVQLAKSVYCVEPACYKNFSDKLLVAVHADEINTYQLFQFIEKLLDEEFRRTYKENNYMRSNNIITHLIVAIVPPEDRAKFLLLIKAPLFKIIDAISQLYLERAASSQPQFVLENEKARLIASKPPRQIKMSDQVLPASPDDLYEFVENAAIAFQELIETLGNISVQKLPPFFKTSCQLITQNLLKHLPRHQDNHQNIVLQVCSFITNKMFAAICFEWIRKTYPPEKEYLKLFNFILLKPLQNLVTSFQFKKNQPVNKTQQQLPALIMQFITQENHIKLISFCDKIINENPNSYQQLCLTMLDCQYVLTSKPLIDIAPVASPKQAMRSNIAAGGNGVRPQSIDSDDDSDSDDSVEEQLKQPTTAHTMASLNELIQAPRGSRIQSAVSPQPMAAQADIKDVLPVVELLKFDKVLDEEDIELRLLIIFEECLALTKILGVYDDLPSQSTTIPKKILTFFHPQATPSLSLPSKSDLFSDLQYISRKLSQINSEDKTRLLALYKALDAAVCSFEGYKSYNLTITKAGLEDPPAPTPAFENISLHK